MLAPDGCVFIADSDNARVVRWAPGAIAGVIVAGGNVKYTALNQMFTVDCRLTRHHCVTTIIASRDGTQIVVTVKEALKMGGELFQL